MAYTPQTWVDGAAGNTPVSAARLTYMESGIQAAHQLVASPSSEPGIVEVDSYPGTDDQKLTAAMTYASGQEFKPTLRLSNREWTFTQQRTLYTGFKITGSGRGIEQVRTGQPYGTEVNCRVGGNKHWLLVTQPTFGCYIGNISFEGTASNRFMTSTNYNGVLWTTTIENVGFTNFLTVMGGEPVGPGVPGKLLMTACLFQGFWNTNNSYGISYTLGGSDNNLWINGGLLDSPPNFTGGSGTGTVHLKLESMGKSAIGPMYVTAEEVSGILITSDYDENEGALVFSGGMRVEGRHPDQMWTNGAEIIIEGNVGVVLRDMWLGYGMKNPAACGRSPIDTGIVTIRSKYGYRPNVLVSGCTYQRGAGVAEEVPFVHNNGGTVRVTDIMRSPGLLVGGGSHWSGLPRVQNVSAGGGSLYSDNSVQPLP